MYTEVRIALVLVASMLAALAAWFARSAVVDNLAALGSWTRTEGLIRSILETNQVEIEIGTEPDSRRVVVSTDHQLFLSEFERVPVYVDPADPAHARAGGLLQLWLWPTTLVLLAALLAGCALAAARVGLSAGAAGYGAGHWRLSAPPPPLDTDLRVHRPASEWKAPLLWSLLGVGAAACGLFARSAAPFQRLGAICLGSFFILLTWALALYNRTTEVAADVHGMRESSAFGWRDLAWEEVASVETREVVPTYRKAFSDKTPFPGSTTRSLVFANRSGRALMRLSIHMQPPDAMRRLLELCSARTGLHEQFRRIIVPDI